MGLIHEEKTYALTIRESATDGSDFSNPDADYRVLFVGEDGLFHLKDSAGAVTTGSASGYTPGGTDVAIADGGTGASTATAGFDALSPMTTAGDIIVGGASGTRTRLAAGATSGHVLTSNGSGAAPSWQAGAGGGGGALFPLDDRTVHGTYGDHYAAGPLDAKWTRRGLADPSELFVSDTWMRVEPYIGTNFGHLQAWTPTDETEIQMAATYYGGGADDGFGIVIMDSAGTGIWLGFRNGTRLGIFTITTYTTATEATTADLDPAQGSELAGEGRKVWYSLIKKGSLYYFRFSFDGATWTHELTAYAPSAFTPDRIGWYQGVQDAATVRRMIAVDWFDVVDNYNVGNNLMITPTSGTVTPTGSATSIGAVANVIDGNTAGTGWADVSSTGSIWWNAAFSVAQTINRLRLWGYNNAWGTGYVELSSGTKIPFYCAASQVMHIDFPSESTTFVKVWCHKQGLGTFPGFYEIEAYLAS